MFGKSFRLTAFILLPIITLGLGWQLGARWHERQVGLMMDAWGLSSSTADNGAVVATDPEKEVDLSLFWMVWRILQKQYIEPGDLEKTPMTFGAIEGMVRAVGDPYTAFMTPKENEEFMDSLQGNLQGIGAELTQRDGLIVVVAPLKGSPAAKAGLAPEDILLTVDGEDVTDKSLNEVVLLVRGEKGTTVTIEVAREGTIGPVELQITREEIHIPSVESEMKELEGQNIAYVALNQFGDGSIQEVETALQDLEDTGMDGIILDLRYNGGGYLDGAQELASLFLREGKVVTVERRESDPEHQYVTGRPLFPDTPLVVLINEGTASAAEIVAGALQDNGRATIIGKQSFGKGTVQEVLELPGGSSLRVTIAKWLTPSGKDLGKEGVHPDIEVDRTIEDLQNEIDPQLERALQELTGTSDTD